MAILYNNIIWDIATGLIRPGTWAKTSETGRGLKVSIVADDTPQVIGSESLRLRYRGADGQYSAINGSLTGGLFAVELDDALAGQVNDVQVDLELTAGGKIISSPTFRIPVYRSIGL